MKKKKKKKKKKQILSFNVQSSAKGRAQDEDEERL